MLEKHVTLSLPGWPWFVGGAVALLLFVVLLLPFLLPLGGPETVHPATLADPNGAFVQVEGERLYYVHTPADGPPVVLLHGFGGSTVSWTDTLPALAAAGFDAYAVDLLGFGLSDKGDRGDYSHAAQAARVAGWMDAIGIDRATVVGHSMGGNVAAYLALAHPDRVDRLILVSAAILNNGHTSVPSFLFDLPFAKRWAQVVLRRAVDTLSSDLLSDAVYNDLAISPPLAEGYQRVFRTPEWDLGLIAMVRDMGSNGLTAPVSAIRAPTLIIWGARDTWVSPGDGVRLESLIPNARRIEFADVGHLPMHEVPEAFNRAVLSFLEDGEN